MSPLQLFFLGMLIAILLLVGVLLLLTGRNSGVGQQRNRRARGPRRERNQGQRNQGQRQYYNDSDHEDSDYGGSDYGGSDYGDEPEDTLEVSLRDRSDRTDGIDAGSGNQSQREKWIDSSAPPKSQGEWNDSQLHSSSSRESTPPRVISGPGDSVDRPELIQNRPPVSLRSRSKLYHYTALVTSVYDGDTLTVDIDMGMNMCAKNQVIRLWKINTPELRGVDRQQGLVVRDLVRDLVLHKHILLRTILDKRGNDKTGKYGRLLGEIILEEESGEVLNLNEYLLAKGLATPYGTDGSAIRSPAPASSPHPGLPRGLPERSAAPMPGHTPDAEGTGTAGNGSQNKGETDCPYCGETRAVDLKNQMVLSCPNCIDGSYWYGEDGAQMLTELG